MAPGFKEQVSPYEIILNELRGLKDDVHEVKAQMFVHAPHSTS